MDIVLLGLGAVLMPFIGDNGTRLLIRAYREKFNQRLPQLPRLPVTVPQSSGDCYVVGFRDFYLEQQFYIDLTNFFFIGTFLFLLQQF